MNSNAEASSSRSSKRRKRTHHRNRPSETPGRPEEDANTQLSREAFTNSAPEAEAPVTCNVGLDLGTTFSSAVFSITRGLHEIVYEVLGYKGDVNTGAAQNFQLPMLIWYRKPGAGRVEEQELNGVLYGYQVQQMLKDPRHVQKGYEEERIVSRPKLAFDPATHDPSLEKDVANRLAPRSGSVLNINTRKLYRKRDVSAKKKLKRSIDLLIEEGTITCKEDVLKHFLTLWFRHIREQMELQAQTKNLEVTFAFAVPVSWNPVTNALYSSVIVAALRALKFGVSKPSEVPRISMFNETESAMGFLVKESDYQHLKAHKHVSVIDCGGGTVDGGSYEVTWEPVRLEKEVGHPTGRWVGSSHINDNFFDLALADLKFVEEDLIEAHGTPLRTQIAAKMMPFFEEEKRAFTGQRRLPTYEFPMPRLDPDAGSKRLQHDAFVVSYEDMKDFFHEPMQAVWDVVREQHQNIPNPTRHRGPLDLVPFIMTGGFSASPALRHFLQNKLSESGLDKQIKFEWAPYHKSVLSTAYGSLYRAREPAPIRPVRLSVGVTRHIPYQTGKEMLRQYPELGRRLKQQHGNASLDFVTNTWYIPDTLKWLLKTGLHPEGRVHRSEFFTTEYEFLEHDETWIQAEEIYVSDKCTEDDWMISHAKNKDKVSLLGNARLDFTQFRGDQRVKFVPATRHRKAHYLLVVGVRLQLIDKDVKIQWRYPAGNDPHPELFQESSFSFVAGFGTQ